MNNSKRKSKTVPQNPLLSDREYPDFETISSEHIVDGIRHLIAETDHSIQLLESSCTPTWETLLAPLEAIERPLSEAWGVVNHLLAVKNTDALRKAHDAVLGDVIAAGLRIRQNEKIYEQLQQIRKQKSWQAFTNAQKRAVELRLRDADHSGVGLEKEKRARFNQITRELSEKSTAFSNNVLDSTKSFELILSDTGDTEGWPESLKQLAANSYNESKSPAQPVATHDSGPWRITLDAPSFIPFLQHSRNRMQRESVYRAYIARASSGKLDNTQLIVDILNHRKEKAELLSFDSFAEMSLDLKMAPSVAAVEKMFSTLFAAAKDHAQSDFRSLQALSSKEGAETDLAHWDIAYWAERLREQTFDYTEEEIRPYFPMPKVLDGLFALCRKLFGITIRPADGKAPVWHPDVRFFQVYDSNDSLAASFYLDPYSRPAEKRGGAWMDSCRSRCIVNGQLRLPVVYLCCNSTPPVDGRPSLMRFDEVKTLFHEFGHGLQGMLTRVDIADVSGINGIEWDAVELPSLFMENWCYHKPTLLAMTAHVDTGDPLPENLFQKICAAKNFRSGSLMMRQLEFGMTDMALHHHFDPAGEASVFDVHQRVASQTSVLPPLPEDRFLCAFSHIFSGGYAAGYYSYKWAEVLSSDAFSAFEEAGLENEQHLKTVGARFRDTVLALGGSMHPMEVFIKFRGREPEADALLRHSGLHVSAESDLGH